MKHPQIILQFGSYRWMATYNEDTNKWVCTEWVLNDCYKGHDRFNTYEVYDDSIEQHVADVFKSRH